MKIFLSQIRLHKNGYPDFIIFGALIIFSIITILLSLTMPTKFTSNIYFQLNGAPIDTYTNLFSLSILIINAKFSNYSVMEGLSCFQFLSGLLNLFAMILNTAFGIIQMNISSMIISESSFSTSNSTLLNEKFGELMDEINSRCFIQQYNCIVPHISTGKCELNVFCVGYNQSTFQSCELAQEDLMLRVLFISISSLIQFVCWAIYFYLQKDSLRFRLKVMRQWVDQRKKKFGEENERFITES